MLKLDLTTNKRARLMNAYRAIRCWPEAPAALRALKDAGIHVAFLSNFTQEMLEAGVLDSEYYKNVHSCALLHVEDDDGAAFIFRHALDEAQ